VSEPRFEGTEALITTSTAQAAKPIASAAFAPAKADTAQLPSALHKLIIDSLDDAKAEEIVDIDLAGKTSLADAMIVATGRSDRHVGAIATQIMHKLKDEGHPAPRVEGMPQCDWVLVDAGDIIVHIFRPEVRQFYNLEKLWGGGRPAERTAS
jgi:ribosome-associated protein